MIKQFTLTSGTHIQIEIKKLNKGRYYEAVSSKDSNLIAVGKLEKGEKIDNVCRELVNSAEKGTLFI